MEKELKVCLEKGKEYLLNNVNHEGYWEGRADNVPKGPEHLQKPSVLTSEAVDALIYLGVENTTTNKGIFYCFKEKVEDTDNIDLLAYRLKALSYSNVPYIQKKAKQILKVILNRQSKEGYWPSFPKTSNLTNFLVVSSILNYSCEKNIMSLCEWLLKNKAMDNLGWGINGDSEKSQVSFSANAVMILLSCKEFCEIKEIEKVIEFIKNKQREDGGWPSSDFTYPNTSTTYPTALVCLILMKKGYLESEILKKGIMFLINAQLEDGSWPLQAGDKKGEHFATGYVLQTLKKYEYVTKKLKEESNIELCGKCGKDVVVDYLMKRFEVKIRKRFLDSGYGLILDKILATTSSAVKRRKVILEILSEEGEKDNAEIIDALKRRAYKELHKRSHLAQIKNDMDALVNLKFVDVSGRKYFLVKKV